MIRLIMPYFGPWPAWMPLFLESCRRQQGYEWILISEEAVPCDLSKNVRFVKMSLAEVSARITAAGLSQPEKLLPYKLCDYKPAYGLIFADLLDGAAFWGHGDLDLAYGRLSEIVNEPWLEGADVFSADDRSCGHFQIYRNEERVNRLIFQIEGLDQLLTLQSTVGLDEPQMSMVMASAEKDQGLKWKRAQSRQLELAKKRPLMGATIESDGSLAEQQLTGDKVYRWADGQANQYVSGHDEHSCELLYLHWFQWKAEAQWQDLLKSSDWSKEGVNLVASDWPMARGKLKSSVRKFLYLILGNGGLTLGRWACRIDMVDKACAFVLRIKAEKQWAAYRGN